MTIRTRLIIFFITGVIVTAMTIGIFVANEVLIFNTDSTFGSQITVVLAVLALIVTTTSVLWGVLHRINRPLAQITTGIEQISSGNLSPDLPSHVPGELGLMNDIIITMCGQLRMVLNQLQTLSKRVVDSTSGAGESFVEIKDGVQIQSQTAARTFDAVGQMSDGLLDASREIEDLAQRIEQSFSTISKMDSAIGNVSETISGLSVTIEQASQNTREGDKNVQTLANDVSDLSTQINTANDALTEMMDGFHSARADAGDAAFIMGSLENQTTRIGAAIEATIKGSNAVNSTNKRILDVTESLQARVDRVDDVLETIHNLAERTKLLSINASIIASEAGEHGRAFAVVALEVKDLAGSTASAISEISQVVSGLKDGFTQTFETIQSGQKEVDRGVRMAREAVELLRSIPDEVSEASALSSKIVRRTELHVERGGHVEVIIGKVVTTLAQVSELLREQVSRNDRILALFHSINLTADQVLVATRDHTEATGSITRDVGKINSEFRMLAGQVRDNTSGLGNIVSLSEEILTITDSNRRRAEDLSNVISELNRYALYLGEDFRKIG